MFTLGNFNHIVKAVPHAFVRHLIYWKLYAINCSSGASPALRVQQHTELAQRHYCLTPATIKIAAIIQTGALVSRSTEVDPWILCGPQRASWKLSLPPRSYAHPQSCARLKAWGWCLGLLCFVQGMSWACLSVQHLWLFPDMPAGVWPPPGCAAPGPAPWMCSLSLQGHMDCGEMAWEWSWFWHIPWKLCLQRAGRAPQGALCKMSTVRHRAALQIW